MSQIKNHGLRRHLTNGLVIACTLISTAGCKRMQRSNQSVANASKVVTSQKNSCSIANQNAQSIFDQSKNSIAVVNTSTGAGSAFVIYQDANHAYLITNSHVVDNQPTVQLKWINKKITQGEIISNSGGSTPQQDLAIIKTRALSGKALLFKPTKTMVGADIIAIGAPQGLNFSLTRGVVSSIRSQGDLLQIDAPINPGNSGGPVLDLSGCVVGIATFKLEDSEGLNFAISSKVASKYADQIIQNIGSNNQPKVRTSPFNSTSKFSQHSKNQPANQNGCSILDNSNNTTTNFQCQVMRRQDPRGYEMYDLKNSNGEKWTIILKGNKKAEVYTSGQRTDAFWQRESNKNILVNFGDYILSFKP